MIDGFLWVFLVVVIDRHARKVVGYYSVLQDKADYWLESLEIVVNRQYTNCVSEQNLKLMSYNGYQPTLTKFIKNCSFMKIKQTVSSY